jgi:LytS/YehU family sensor histidine kinase
VERRIASDTLDAEVPTLILQPLIENAIRHGITPRAGGGRIEIISRLDEDRLIVTVRDDGAGLRDGWKAGVGIGNTAARLEQLHPGRHTFTVENDPRGGALVTLEVPYSHG